MKNLAKEDNVCRHAQGWPTVARLCRPVTNGWLSVRRGAAFSHVCPAHPGMLYSAMVVSGKSVGGRFSLSLCQVEKELFFS